ncbi:MAG: BLUF domain-containing protein [Actinomycetota bacterium]
MSDPLLQLAYVSNAVRPLDREELIELMRHARKKNKRLEITGMLLVEGSRFLQVLEGPPAAVSDLYDAIRLDERHECVTTIFCDEQLRQRQYAQWLMGCKILGEGLPADFAALDDRVKDVLRRADADGEAARQLLLDFRRIESEFIDL